MFLSLTIRGMSDCLAGIDNAEKKTNATVTTYAIQTLSSELTKSNDRAKNIREKSERQVSVSY